MKAGDKVPRVRPVSIVLLTLLDAGDFKRYFSESFGEVLKGSNMCLNFGRYT